MRNLIARAAALPMMFAVISIAFALELPATIGGYPTALDGDDLLISGFAISLQGIAAPEDNKRKREPGGPEATASLAQIVKGKFVQCRPDGTRTRGRVMAICTFLKQPPTRCDDIIVEGRPAKNCEHEVADIGELQVLAGHARDCPRFSSGRYAEAEAKARAAGRDLSAIFPMPAHCGNGK